jgi:hypothetical protein
MKKIIFIFFVIVTSQAISQTKFAIGFSDGYKIGYCYDQKVGCISPVPPVAPIPKIGESFDSYFDGYNRGLLDGTSEKSRIKNSQSYSNSTSVYGQPRVVKQMERFTPNYSFYENGIKQTQNNYQKTGKSQDEIDNKFFEELEKQLDEYNSAKNVAKREQYIKLLKQYYTELKVYPKTIPDGVYKITETTEPTDNEKNPRSFNYDFVEGDAIVENNKIIGMRLKDPITDRYYDCLSLDKFPNAKYNRNGITIITKSDNISNGLGIIATNLFISGKIFPENAIGVVRRVYFIDYIITYQNAQKCIEEIKKSYNALTSYPKIQNGWNKVYANNGEDFCEVKEVFVENGKVTKYKISEGNEAIITSEGSIIKNKSTITFIGSLKNGGKEETYTMELYFMN